MPDENKNTEAANVQKICTLEIRSIEADDVPSNTKQVCTIEIQYSKKTIDELIQAYKQLCLTQQLLTQAMQSLQEDLEHSNENIGK